MKKIPHYVGIVLFCCVITCTGFTQSHSKKTLSVKGLHGPVQILRDQWGVNHIYANNEHDLFFTQGYCAAQDRLFQFEIWRRQATGTTAEILGARELKRDIGTRLFKYRGDLNKDLTRYHPNGVAIINAYVQGVNAYIRQVNANPHLLPFEFKLLRIQPGYWTPEIVISRHQGLLGNITQELNIARAIAKVGEEKVKDIIRFHPKEPNLRMDSVINTHILDKDILGLYNAYRNELVFQKSDFGEIDEDAVYQYIHPKEKDLFLQSQEMEGSNNWIIAGEKSASGFPLLANDPHRKIAVPSLRYIVHLVAPGWNVIGGGEPVIPGVSIGHNEKGAWGLTIFETDGEDLYVYDLNKDNLNQYWHKGKWVSMKVIREEIPIKNSQSQKVDLKYTVHGPVCFIDSLHKKAYAVKAAWMEPGGAPYLASLRINQATDWETFREACSYSHIPGENMIWADKKGNIGWQAVGIIPIRKNFSGYVPIPGDGRYEWSGYLPIKERPHSLNPEKGFFATANQNVTPENYTHWEAIGYTWADPYRGDRINQVLSKNNAIDLAQMASLQTDYYSIPASQLVPLLNNIEMTDSMASMAKKIITEWNYVLDKESIAAGIYIAWEKEIAALMSNKFIPASIKSFVSFQVYTIVNKLVQPEKYFGEDAVQNRNALLKEALLKAVSNLKNKLGHDMQAWQYGQAKYKHITMEHPLSSMVKGEIKKALNLGPLPRGGSGQTPGSTGSADNQLSGASFRLLIDTKDWDKTLMINTPGQSGNYKSPYYKNLFELWANDQYFPSYYTKELIKKVTVEETQLQPK